MDPQTPPPCAGSPVPRPLAERLRALEPSCGPVRLVAVDGHAGSGKSTFAGRLADALGGAPVVHLDDVATHDELFSWTRRLDAGVLRPLERAADAWCPVYDWDRRRFGSPVRVPCAPVVLVEGVGAGRSALRPRLACVLWMELPREEARERGLRRDGPALRDFWRGWVRAEDEHFAADPTRPYADLLVRRAPYGYEVLPGPAGGFRPVACH
jgi:uridine kinase